MNIELLGRQAIEIIKYKYGLPLHGFVSGGSIANIVWELVSGNKAIVNDIDIFVFDRKEEINDNEGKELFRYQEKENQYFDGYKGLCFSSYTKDFYSIIESEKDGIFNIIHYVSNVSDPSIIIRSFDINSTRIGYDIDNDKLYWMPDFEDFLKTGELKITNLMTPSHTAIRIIKKKVELNAKLDTFEFNLIQYVLNHNFIDRIKLRFMDRYFELYKKYEHLIKDFFNIVKDVECVEYTKDKYNKDINLYYLESTLSKGSLLNCLSGSPSPFDDDNLCLINKSSDFLFYMRNIYNNSDELKELWSKLSYFFTNIDYIDNEVSIEDIELLYRFVKNAPSSINNLRGYKLSEQIGIIKKFLDNYKEDPIIAISILEKIKVSKDIELDEQTSLILELSVRKHIIENSSNKVKNILYPT